MEELRYLWLFVLDLGKQWVALMGGVASIILATFSAYFEWTVSWKALTAVGIVCLFVACYWAWRQLAVDRDTQFETQHRHFVLAQLISEGKEIEDDLETADVQRCAGHAYEWFKRSHAFVREHFPRAIDQFTDDPPFGGTHLLEELEKQVRAQLRSLSNLRESLGSDEI